MIDTAIAPQTINRGTTQYFSDLARVDVTAGGGQPRVSIYRVTPYALPLAIRMLERHALGSQLFMPLHDEPFLVVVAPPGDKPTDVRAFVTSGRQGVNYHRGTWHHPVIALREASEFLVLDRAGPGENCDECVFERDQLVLRAPDIYLDPDLNP